MKQLSANLISGRDRSARLRYEAIGPEHADALAPAMCDPRVYEFIDAAAPAGSEELRATFLRKEAGAPAHLGDEQWLDIAVFRQDTGEAIGRVEAALVGNRAELAWMFGPEHWGLGFASEAMRWLHALLTTLPPVAEFWATVHPGNERSIKLARRLGYRAATAWPELGSYHPGDLVFRRAAMHDETPWR